MARSGTSIVDQRLCLLQQPADNPKAGNPFCNYQKLIEHFLGRSILFQVQNRRPPRISKSSTWEHNCVYEASKARGSRTHWIWRFINKGWHCCYFAWWHFGSHNKYDWSNPRVFVRRSGILQLRRKVQAHWNGNVSYLRSLFTQTFLAITMKLRFCRCQLLKNLSIGQKKIICKCCSTWKTPTLHWSWPWSTSSKSIKSMTLELSVHFSRPLSIGSSVSNREF